MEPYHFATEAFLLSVRILLLDEILGVVLLDSREESLLALVTVIFSAIVSSLNEKDEIHRPATIGSDVKSNIYSFSSGAKSFFGGSFCFLLAIGNLLYVYS